MVTMTRSLSHVCSTSNSLGFSGHMSERVFWSLSFSQCRNCSSRLMSDDDGHHVALCYKQVSDPNAELKTQKWTKKLEVHEITWE